MSDECEASTESCKERKAHPTVTNHLMAHACKDESQRGDRSQVSGV